MKVVKFGGSSLANAEQFKKVGDIVRADRKRRYVIPSAPGKRFPGDTKVTDLLYKMEEQAENGEDYSETFEEIKSRFTEIIEGLALENFSLDDQFEEIHRRMEEDPDADYAASRGEHLNGRIMAAYLGYTFVDPFEMIFFDEDGGLDDRKTMRAVEKRLAREDYAVIPGFYGCSYDGKVKAFPAAVRILPAPSSQAPATRMSTRTGPMYPDSSLRIPASSRIPPGSRRSPTVSSANFPTWAPLFCTRKLFSRCAVRASRSISGIPTDRRTKVPGSSRAQLRNRAMSLPESPAEKISVLF